MIKFVMRFIHLMRNLDLDLKDLKDLNLKDLKDLKETKKTKPRTTRTVNTFDNKFGLYICCRQEQLTDLENCLAKGKPSFKKAGFL